MTDQHRNTSFVLLVAALTLFAFLGLVQHTAYADTLYVGVNDGSFYGVATFTPTLGLIDQTGLPVSGAITGLAVGTGGNYYIGAGNHLYQFDSGGNLLHSISGSATTTLPALSFLDGTLYVGVNDGSFYGVARLTENLGLIDQIGLPVSSAITSLAAGASSDYYIGAGNHLYQFDFGGNLLHSISGSATTTLPALSFLDGMLYAGVNDGSFYGVARLTENLGLIDQIGLPISSAITSLAAGPGGDYYVGAGNHLYQFDSGGNLIRSISGSATTTLPALSYFADQPDQNPIPEPASGALLLCGLAGMWFIVQRRKA